LEVVISVDVKTILAELKRLNISVKKITPRTKLEAGSIHLGGDYAGILISVGTGSYTLSRKSEDYGNHFMRGHWLLESELNRLNRS